MPELNLKNLKERYYLEQARPSRRQPVRARAKPSLFQYDYLILSLLAKDLEFLVRSIPSRSAGGLALDVGAGLSPYRNMIASAGFEVKTVDLDENAKADLAGTAYDIPSPDASVDLILCTQVLEHLIDPWEAMNEFHRILRPGGHIVFSVPHVWFYHPHPDDYYRFTPEGVTALCSNGKLEPVILCSQGGSIACAAQIICFLVFGVIGVFGAPFYAMANVFSQILDRLVPNDLFAMNFACLAKKH